MGVWGVGSDENDGAADAICFTKDSYGLYANADEGTPLEGAALADAQDAALLSGEGQFMEHGLPGSVMALLREGYRVPQEVLEEAEEELRSEDVAAAGWYDGGEERSKAIEAELALMSAARANDNQLPTQLRDRHASKSLIETIVSKKDPEGCGEAVQAERAERENSVIPTLPPPPFGWLDEAGLNVVVNAAKHIGVRRDGLEKHEVVGAIKAHSKRWNVRRFAPYAVK